MEEYKKKSDTGKVITLNPKQLSVIAGTGVLYSVLVFLSGYIVGQRKAAATLLKRFKTEYAAPAGTVKASIAIQHVTPAQCISLGYFGTPEQAHDLARWGEQTTDLSFKVCECQIDDADTENNGDGTVYHVISETCSNDAVFDAVLRRLVPHRERSECNQFRLLTV